MGTAFQTTTTRYTKVSSAPPPSCSRSHDDFNSHKEGRVHDLNQRKEDDAAIDDYKSVTPLSIRILKVTRMKHHYIWRGIYSCVLFFRQIEHWKI